MSDFLQVLRERVLVFDGATGTNLQLRDLSADDFGGPDLEGCNEILVATRPDVIADLHASFLEVGCDAVGGRELGGVEHGNASAGSGARIEEPAAVA